MKNHLNQLVDTQTRRRDILDHVYITENLRSRTEYELHGLYFSDHDAVCAAVNLIPSDETSKMQCSDSKRKKATRTRKGK